MFAKNGINAKNIHLLYLINESASAIKKIILDGKNIYIAPMDCKLSTPIDIASHKGAITNRKEKNLKTTIIFTPKPQSRLPLPEAVS
jgi:hypothetical protein